MTITTRTTRPLLRVIASVWKSNYGDRAHHKSDRTPSHALHKTARVPRALPAIAFRHSCGLENEAAQAFWTHLRLLADLSG
jgi:hypothetical protein